MNPLIPDYVTAAERKAALQRAGRRSLLMVPILLAGVILASALASFATRTSVSTGRSTPPYDVLCRPPQVGESLTITITPQSGLPAEIRCSLRRAV